MRSIGAILRLYSAVKGDALGGVHMGQLLHTFRAHTLSLEEHDVLGGVAKNTAGFVLFEYNG